jgi:2-dehydro-3-deoxyphosphogluconate aldolase/(4S)-4-hydroxy-2-oxoglutarate aldolase
LRSVTGFDPELVDSAVKRDTAVLPGALTPSEVMAAWKAGVDLVKIFPCAQVSGPDYIRAIKAPFPHIPLIASGGVTRRTRAISSLQARPGSALAIT